VKEVILGWIAFAVSGEGEGKYEAAKDEPDAWKGDGAAKMKDVGVDCVGTESEGGCVEEEDEG
jgi:hypothetical protein